MLAAVSEASILVDVQMDKQEESKEEYDVGELLTLPRLEPPATTKDLS